MKPSVLVIGAVAALVLVAGCESPTAPTTLDLAGTYRGVLTLKITDAPREPPMREDADMAITVTQTGSSVTLSGTIQWPGEPVEDVFQRLTGTVDEDGVFHGDDPEDFDDPICGRVRYGRRVIVFYADASMEYVQDAETGECGRFDFQAFLRRL